MPWTYHQSSGGLEDPLETIICSSGYSGFGEGKNNADAEYIPGLGPIPKGTYVIRGAIDHLKLGPVAMPLIPEASNQMYGRSGFWIHGASIFDEWNASTGSIILPRDVRESISASSDKILVVVK
jgi:hypothetical protein